MSNSAFITRETVTQAILKGKRENKLTFSQIASIIGRNKVHSEQQFTNYVRKAKLNFFLFSKGLDHCRYDEPDQNDNTKPNISLM